MTNRHLTDSSKFATGLEAAYNDCIERFDYYHRRIEFCRHQMDIVSKRPNSTHKTTWWNKKRGSIQRFEQLCEDWLIGAEEYLAQMKFYHII